MKALLCLFALLCLTPPPRRAVVQVLTTQYGNAPARLLPYGNGPYAPLAFNDTEDAALATAAWSWSSNKPAKQ